MSHTASLHSPIPTDPIIASDVADLVAALTAIHTGTSPLHDRLEVFATDTHTPSTQPQAWPQGIAIEDVTVSAGWPTPSNVPPVVDDSGLVYTIGVGTGVDSLRTQHYSTVVNSVPFAATRVSASNTAWSPWVVTVPSDHQAGGRVGKIREVIDTGLTAWTTTRAVVWSVPAATFSGVVSGAQLRADFVCTAHFDSVPANRTVSMFVGHDPAPNPISYPGVRVQRASTPPSGGSKPTVFVTTATVDVNVQATSTGEVRFVVDGFVDTGTITPSAIEISAKLYRPTP